MTKKNRRRRTHRQARAREHWLRSKLAQLGYIEPPSLSLPTREQTERLIELVLNAHDALVNHGEATAQRHAIAPRRGYENDSP